MVRFVSDVTASEAGMIGRAMDGTSVVERGAGALRALVNTLPRRSAFRMRFPNTIDAVNTELDRIGVARGPGRDAMKWGMVRDMLHLRALQG